MPWTLEIHHIAVGGAGDSTLIVARHPQVGANPAITRTVLVDGGIGGAATLVHNYINGLNYIQRVDVIVVTHFDEDHYYGVTKLLKRAAGSPYDNAILYDTGRLPND